MRTVARTTQINTVIEIRRKAYVFYKKGYSRAVQKLKIIVPCLLLSARVFMTIDVFLLKYLGMYSLHSELRAVLQVMINSEKRAL